MLKKLAAACLGFLAGPFVLMLLGFGAFGTTQAANITIPAPFDSVNFGRRVAYLPNDNIVVNDPSAGPSGVGAVYVYRPDGTLLSTLKGGSANDNIGDLGIRILPNGNFLVLSENWQNGGLARSGAVTFVNAATGLNGTVSAANSLVGSATGDSDNRQVVVLDSGHYLVLSPLLDLPGNANFGAITWGSGTTGVAGVIGAGNSLVGANVGGLNGVSLAQLTNGHFVLGLPLWNGVGAAVWCPGSTGCAGSVNDNVAMIGASPGGQVGSRVQALANGHYIVGSQFWDNGPMIDTGIVTWANGTTGFDGTPTAANSWTSAEDHRIGSSGLLPLTNGNFVIMSGFFPNGGALRAGAATWVDGSGPSSGVVSTANSIVGTSMDDQIGSQYVALANGNFVVGSGNWANGAATGAGAARWGNGLGGSIGPVSPANALVGTTSGDSVGGQIDALPNGNYVVRTTRWNNGAAVDAGAVTFGNGATGVAGAVSAANSLVGTTSFDEFGTYFKVLANNNVLVGAGQWDNGGTADVGIVTWMNGSTGATGAVSGGNSLIGATSADRIGTELLALSNGNYLVLSRNWDGGATDVGAITWGNGTGGTTGFVSAANSLIGAIAADGTPALFGTTLPNGRAVVGWPGFNVPALTDAGALVSLSGSAPTVGVMAPGTSFVGSSTSEQLGSPAPTAYSDGSVVLKVPNWDTGVAPANIGAVCLLDGGSTLSGQVNPNICVLGSQVNLGSTMVADYSTRRRQMVVGIPFENKVVILDFRMFADGFE